NSNIAGTRLAEQLVRPSRHSGSAAVHDEQNTSVLDPAFQMPGITFYDANANQNLRHSTGNGIEARLPQRLRNRTGRNQRTDSRERQHSYTQRPRNLILSDTRAGRGGRGPRLLLVPAWQRHDRQAGLLETLLQQKLDGVGNIARPLENTADNSS